MKKDFHSSKIKNLKVKNIDRLSFFENLGLIIMQNRKKKNLKKT